MSVVEGYDTKLHHFHIHSTPGTGGVRDEAAVFAAEQGVDLAPRE